MKRHAAMALVTLLAATTACRRPPADSLVEYEGEVVRGSDFDAYVRALESSSGPLAAEVRGALRKSFIEESVLALEARRQGLLPAGASRETQALAVKTLLARQTAALEVGDGEVVADYAARREQLREPPTITLSQILMRSDREALDLRDRLGRDLVPFELAARAQSIAPEAARNGVMGVFRQGELPKELERPAWTLPVGGMSGVIASPLGYHILRLERRDPGRVPTLEEARPAIHARLLAAKTERGERQFLASLLSRARVTE